MLSGAGEEEIELRPKAFDVLRHLVENSGRVITKDELIKAVWRGLAVTDDALVQCVSDVWHALCDEAQRLIKTVPRRGYVFSVEVSDGTSNTYLSTQPGQKVHVCRTKDDVNIAMALSGQGMPVVRTATWFNHLEYDWNVQLRGALLRFLCRSIPADPLRCREPGVGQIRSGESGLQHLRGSRGSGGCPPVAEVRPPWRLSGGSDSHCPCRPLSRAGVKVGVKRRFHARAEQAWLSARPRDGASTTHTDAPWLGR